MLLRHYLEQGWTKTKIAEHLSLTTRTIERWIAAGALDRDLDAEPVRYGPRPAVPTKLAADEHPRLPQPPDRRRDRLSPDLEDRRDALLPTHREAVRAGEHRPHEQQELRRMGRDLRRRSDGGRADRPPRPSLPHRQHPGKQLSDASSRRAPYRAAPGACIRSPSTETSPRSRDPLGLVTPGPVRHFHPPILRHFQPPLTLRLCAGDGSQIRAPRGIASQDARPQRSSATARPSRPA